MRDFDSLEYTTLRKEVESVKTCITQYIGFVLGGSGLTVIIVPLLINMLLNRSGIPDNLENLQLSWIELIIATVCYSASLLIALITVIVFYKFNSHNRYCGYLRAVAGESVRLNYVANEQQLDENPAPFTAERDVQVFAPYPASRVDVASQHNQVIFGWESCLDYIKATETDEARRRMFRERADKIREAIINSLPNEQRDPMLVTRRPDSIGDICKYLSIVAEPQKNRKTRGSVLMLSSLFGRAKTRSWGFPFPVTNVLVFLSIMFAAVGITVTWLDFSFVLEDGILTFEIRGRNVLLAGLSTAIMGGFLLWFWVHTFGRLFRLMHKDGDRTISAYCARFLVARHAFLEIYKARWDWGRCAF